MTDLPSDYPHEKAVYMYGELVELVGAKTYSFDASDGSTIDGHELFYCWFDVGDVDAYRGIRTDRMAHFKADGGLSTLNEILLNLPERRVEGRELLE